MIPSFGYIYRISDNFNCYYGSTFKPIAYRYAQHKNSYNKWLATGQRFSSSYLCLPNSKIELMESIPGITKLELLQLERKYIDTWPCVNKNRPIISCAERMQAIRDYYRSHWDAINARKNERIICERCGAGSSRTNITHHKKSKKCMRT